KLNTVAVRVRNHRFIETVPGHTRGAEQGAACLRLRCHTVHLRFAADVDGDMRPADKLRVRRCTGQARQRHQLDGRPVIQGNKVRFKPRTIFADVAVITAAAKHRFPELNLRVQAAGPECDMCNIHKIPRYLSVRTFTGKTGYTLVLSATS